MLIHEAVVSILHRLCYNNQNLRFFTLPETSISGWNWNISTDIL